MIYPKKENLMQWKEELLTTAVILACILLYSFFPTIGVGQKITASLVFFLVTPVLYTKFILHKTLSDFGFSLQNPRAGLLWGGTMLIASLGLALLLFYFSELKNYALPSYAVSSFWYFLLYELVFVNLFFFLQEFFFKGFILFAFAQRFHYWAIAFSVLVYAVLSAAAGNLAWQTAPFLILSLTGGIVAYKSNSFLYSYFMGLSFIIFFDAYLIYLLK